MANTARRLKALLPLIALCSASLFVSAPAGAVGGHYAFAVLGQLGSFTSSTANIDGISANGLSGSWDGDLDTVNHRLYVADAYNNRVLVYNLDSTDRLIDTTADFVIGQTTMGGGGAARSATRLNGPTSVLVANDINRLFIADNDNNRVMVYDLQALATGMPAVQVLGQPDFITSTNITGASGMKAPSSLAIDTERNRLYVGDNGNSRILVFDLATQTNGPNAINVIGQSDFVTYTSGAGANKFTGINDLDFDAVTSALFVADGVNHRVLSFDTGALFNGMAASYVYGQADFSGTTSSRSASGFNFPTGVTLDGPGRRMFIADRDNNRVLIFAIDIFSSGVSAYDVIGQGSFTSSFNAVAIHRTPKPRGIAYANGHLFVAQPGYDRATVFYVPAPRSTTAIGVSVPPSLTFSVAGRTIDCNAVALSADVRTSATAIPLGRLSNGGQSTGGQSMEVISNGIGGATVTVQGDSIMSDGAGHAIPALLGDGGSASNSTPVTFPSTGTAALGYTVDDQSLSGGAPTRFFDGGARWAPLSSTPYPVLALPTIGTKTGCIALRAQVAPQIIAGAYSARLVYSAVGHY